MLSELTIENVAVIEKANVIFDKGLNVLTGETGAGKSILIDSIGAILGSRVSRDLVRTGADKAVIWARFSDVSAKVRGDLEKSGYECDDELILQREINRDGKTVCRINSAPTTAAMLKQISAGLIDIHGQHDTTGLLNPAGHINVLDCYAHNQDEHEAYYLVYRELCRVKREIKALDIDESEKTRQVELLKYTIDEIESAQLTVGEDAQLSERKEQIRHSQDIITALQMAYFALNGDDNEEGAVTKLGIATKSLEAISTLSQDYAKTLETLNDFYYGARDAASELNTTIQSQDFDAADLDSIENRLDNIYKLKQKYGQSIETVLEHLLECKEKLDNIQFSSEHLATLRIQQREMFDKAKQLADVLSDTRVQAFARFSADITKTLDFLNMPSISFTLGHTKGALASLGQDTIEFYISTNKGEVAKPLAKIASGGELSRVMLAIKSALADKDEIGTQIYDEIDSGVSGLAAGRIGEKLRDAAINSQVICITHTAQIASFAHTHLLISKSTDGNRTYTQVNRLDDNERVKELARIISGDKVTEISLANAREMLQLHKTT